MVKADLSRDYYGDLEVSPNADANDIKKQFKKLALLYHPDRNPGREAEVTARFQKIQSAHEVLTDSHERAKYDSNRIRTNNIYRTGGNQRGNPWAHVSSQFPTPPKPPTARARPPQPPPPSAGAQRYKNFEAPRQSANQSAQEGAEARRSTYEAWERMRDRPPPTGYASNKPAPPPRKEPKASHNEGATFKQHAHARSQSQNSPHRKGFTPSTPGGDEPAAPRTAYATHREKPAQAPPTTGGAQPSMRDRTSAEPSRKHSKAKAGVQFEPRMSTPYATHGGEKFNPFETININRSKSTRIPSNKYSSDGMPRVGSDSNLSSSHRPRPEDPAFTKPSSTYATPDSDDSSSDNGPQIKKKATPRATTAGTRTFAKARSFTGTRTKPSPFMTYSMNVEPNGPGTSGNANTSAHERPSSSQQTSPPQTSEPSIFSFHVDENTFNPTNPGAFKPSGPESVNTTFSPADWEAKFESKNFAPDQPSTAGPRYPRQQSASRVRGRSPTKSRSGEKKPSGQVDPDLPIESSPSGTKFSKDEWAGTFKPQTFMPAPPASATTPGASRVARKSRVSSIKPTMGTAAVVDDGDTSDDKPLFKGRNPIMSESKAAQSPDPMDVDTPATSAVPTPGAAEEPNGDTRDAPNATPGPTQAPADTESLKANFEDLEIQDGITSLSLPKPPTAPQVPAALLPPTADTIDAYLEKFKAYMGEWDLFSSQMLLHLVTRKTQNETLGPTRWLNAEGNSFYRKGLKEDAAVLSWWIDAMEKHGENMKQCRILKAANHVETARASAGQTAGAQ